MTESTKKQNSRRRFLAASAATAVAAPTIVPSSVFAKPGEPAPSDRVVVASIGTGDLGRRHHLNGMLLSNPRVQVGAVCDVDRNHRDQAAKDVFNRTKKRVGIYKDFRQVCERKDIDAVLIAVPDHWHALISIYAMECGKDVYCEKPLTLTIEESQVVARTAKRQGTVFQTGSQQRSDRNFRHACELVRNEKIGKLKRIDTHIGGIDSGSWMPATTPPAELDWEFWLGPAPYADYAPNRCHYQFRWFSDYSGGKMTDWGAHHNDIAQWGVGADESGPVKVSGKGVFHANGPHDVAGEFDVAYTYENGVELHCHSQGENGIKFTGTNGWVFVSRGKIDASDKDLLKLQFGGSDVRLYESNHHHNNWLDCIQSRKDPICHAGVGHRSVTVCHLGNIALKLGRELKWDPKAERFVGDDQANAMISKPMRSPWRIT